MLALVGSLVATLALAESTPPPEPPLDSPVHRRALVPAILSGLTLVGGATFLVVGQLHWGRAATLPTQDEVDAARANATAQVVGGAALLGIGMLTAGMAAVLYAWVPTPSGIQLAWAPAPGGGLLTVGVALP
jgi:hypothetical protein